MISSALSLVLMIRAISNILLLDILFSPCTMSPCVEVSPCIFIVLGLCYGVVLVAIICSLISVYIKQAQPVWVISLISVALAWLAFGVAFKFVFSVRDTRRRRLDIGVEEKNTQYGYQRDSTSSSADRRLS